MLSTSYLHHLLEKETRSVEGSDFDWKSLLYFYCDNLPDSKIEEALAAQKYTCFASVRCAYWFDEKNRITCLGDERFIEYYSDRCIMLMVDSVMRVEQYQADGTLQNTILA